MTRLWSNLDPAAVVRNCPASEIEAILRDAVAEIVRRDAEQIADTPGAGIIPEEDALHELRLLYNHTEDDSRQFTRWQMLTAMQHGVFLAEARTLAKAGQS